jgi:hypothetical protein
MINLLLTVCFALVYNLFINTNYEKTFQLTDVLNEPILRDFFRKFSTLEHSSENLDIWEHVEKFKKMKPKERKPEAQRIFDIYSKSEEINVSADQSKSNSSIKKK